jgi:hypothetical protein
MRSKGYRLRIGYQTRDTGQQEDLLRIESALLLKPAILPLKKKGKLYGFT